jgi:hypothetical protein
VYGPARWFGRSGAARLADYALCGRTSVTLRRAGSDQTERLGVAIFGRARRSA